MAELDVELGVDRDDLLVSEDPLSTLTISHAAGTGLPTSRIRGRVTV